MDFTMAGNVHTMLGTFLFAPNGTIPACVVNALGSWHDLQIADYGHFYDKLELMFIAYHAKTFIERLCICLQSAQKSH
jgi:hypothetical protein